MTKGIKKSVLITDLDNTLYDWVLVWYESFNAMLNELIKISGLPRTQLIQDIKKVHEKHGTSEYAFVIQEIESLQDKHPNKDINKIYKAAVDAYREARRAHLKLYPTVMETLVQLKDRGCLLIGYTESMAFYTNYRVRKLKLDNVLDILFSPEDHELPKGLSPEQLRMYPPATYEFKHTQHKHTPPGELKPNPKILSEIIHSVGSNPDECVYVGDSLMKDIAMAQEAQVADVHAAYGSAQHTDAY
ncbi:MAG: HAD family hydrolase, partial [Vampirovibrio sp.]|nr:HAD family hydrolase [Vampirovibrio sp.]